MLYCSFTKRGLPWPPLQRAPGLRLIFDTDLSVSHRLISSCFHCEVAAAGIGLCEVWYWMKAAGWLRLWNGGETPFSCSICVFQGEASRYIFLNKFRKFLQENASNRGVRTSHMSFNPQESEYCRLRNDEESGLQQPNRSLTGSQNNIWPNQSTAVQPEQFRRDQIEDWTALCTGHHYHSTKPTRCQ